MKDLGKNMTVSKLLQWLFVAEILGLLGALPISVLGSLLRLLSGIAVLVALYAASGLDEGYRNAFQLCVARVAVNLLSMIFRGGLFNSLLGLAQTVLALAVVYFVISSSCEKLERIDCRKTAGLGKLAWKLYLAGQAANVIVLPLIAALASLGLVLAVVGLLVMLAGGVCYMVFLYKGHKDLA